MGDLPGDLGLNVIDVALRQRLLQFSNLCLGEGGVLVEKQHP